MSDECRPLNIGATPAASFILVFLFLVSTAFVPGFPVLLDLTIPTEGLWNNLYSH